MKTRLSFKNLLYVSSMLFGLFFGAGNLIFPVYMGQLAGQNLWKSVCGFLITGVTLPMLAVAALGKSRSYSLPALGNKVSKGFSLFFTCALYLTIGPFFAIPRCATTSFTVGVAPMFTKNTKLILFIFSLLFFLAVTYFSLRSSRILDWVGKFLNPIFLIFLSILIITAIINPMAEYKSVAAVGTYSTNSFMNGFYEGYNTMDALAGLAFGIVVVTVIKSLGVKDGDSVSGNTILAGIFSCLLMGLIYLCLAYVGASSTNVIGLCNNGGEALALIAKYYFGQYGQLLLAAIVTFACLKTAVGLIVSCSETFYELFPKLNQKTYTIIFILISFFLANLGLNQIIKLSLPVLMFLYPLAMVLITLAMFSNFYKKDDFVYKWTIYATLPAAIIELLKAINLPTNILDKVNYVANLLPLNSMGLGWIWFALFGFIVSFIYSKLKKD